MTRVKMVALVSCGVVSLLALNTAFSQPARRAGRAAGNRPDRQMTRNMERMGMDQETIRRCKMLMYANVSRSNPSSLLALKDDLKLTEEQQKKLTDLVKETREKARAILTEEQVKQVDALPVQPASCMVMHQKMASLMQEKGASPMKCPMMEAAGAATKPAAEQP